MLHSIRQCCVDHHHCSGCDRYSLHTVHIRLYCVSIHFMCIEWGDFYYLPRLYALTYAKFCVRNKLRHLRSRLFHHCRVFAHRVSKMPLCQKRKDAKSFASAQLCQNLDELRHFWKILLSLLLVLFIYKIKFRQCQTHDLRVFLTELGRCECFRVFAHLTRRHFSDAMGEVTTVLEKTWTQKTYFKV